jgi:APA family basic amino acid/polyamine antiporter
LARLFATKPLSLLLDEAHEEGEHTLKRSLGPINLITLGIGAVIGAGIFVLTGQAAAIHAGPAIALSFVLAGVTAAVAGLCYAEFASIIPIAGSAYTYGYVTLGEFVAWIIGWDLVLEYAFGAATVASGWSGYFTSLLEQLHIVLSPGMARFTTTTGTVLYNLNGRWLTKGALSMALPPGTNVSQLPHVTGVFNLVAFLAILVITTILVIGIQESANFNTLIVIVKLACVGIFLVLGINFLLHHPALAKMNWHPFIPPKDAEGNFGISGIAAGAASVFFAYIGFDAVSTAAQEAKNPQRDMPIGILHHGVADPDWPGELQGAQCRRPGGGGHRCDGRGMGQPAGEDRRRLWTGDGDAGDAARPVARLLFDVARWPAPEVGERHPSQIPHAVDLEHGGGLDRGVSAGGAADRPAL